MRVLRYPVLVQVDCVGLIVGGNSLLHANQRLVDKARRRCLLKNKTVTRLAGSLVALGDTSQDGVLLLRSNNS